MKKNKAFVLILALLLIPGLQPWADAARRQRTVKPAEPVIEVMDAFRDYVKADPFLSDNTQKSINNEIDKYCDDLVHRSDKADYIEKNHLREYVTEQRQKLSQYQEQSSLIIENILQKYENMEPQKRVAYRDTMQMALDEKFNALSTNLTRLDKEINVKEEEPLMDLPWKWIGIAAGALLLLIILLVIVSKSKKNKPARPAYRPTTAPRNNVSSYGNRGGGQQQSADGGIVVRRKTATILKKQSLEDVIDNPNYLQVDAIDFTYESAVRRMYIKNSCIVDIYNMYAEDLRNPASPKEDGCMVLGRWVHDSESNEYYVSLEEIVLPGDDAVFEEYALNFGGKIKLKVLEQLRKLRRETNLQYDLTCWVHSHPGLGVFFSNSDTSVQDQLKHPQHPNFLTAIVVDILTPMQDLGIFTFRRDTTINSKNDLKKMYSLVEWYQWAQESLKTSVERPVAATPKEFKSVEYFNMLQNAQEHNDSCYGVELSKNVVVDICTDLVGQGDDILAMLHGVASQHGSQIEYVAEQISDKESEPKLSLTGCFMAAPHCSIPTVRRAVADYLDRIRFVVVYTPNDGLLTTIPVINSDLCTEESCYGEQKLEDLKTWIKQSR